MFGITDWVLFTLSLMVSLGIGIYHGYRGRKATTTEYLLADRKLQPVPLAMSLMIGTVSAITIFANAGEMYAYGTQMWVLDLGMALGMVIVGKVFIPVFYPLKMVSLYEYMEQRFGSRPIRLATAACTMAGGYFFIGFLLALPAMVLVPITGLNVYINIVIMGIPCTLYSAFGGVKAVVYADVFQALVLISGVLSIIFQGSIDVGGFSAVWEVAYQYGRIEFFNFSLDPYLRHTFWSVNIYGILFGIYTYGVIQAQTQRAFSTGSTQKAQLVLYLGAFGMVFIKSLINISGLVIFAKYVECDPLTGPGSTGDPTFVVLIYILQNLSKIPGLTGLFSASIYAAVLSSISTQLNSLTALLWADFLKDIPVLAKLTEEEKGYAQKAIVFCTGVVGVLTAMITINMKSTFLTALLRITGAISGPMVGIFFVALFLPWVNAKSAVVSFVISNIISLWIVIGQIVTQGKYEFLPLSRENCTKAAVANNITEAPNERINTTDYMFPISREQPSGTGIYGMSYTLIPLWGTLACVLTAIVATFIFGANRVEDVDEFLIEPRIWKFFSTTKLFERFQKKSSSSREEIAEKSEKLSPEAVPLQNKTEVEMKV
ncbi:unnamed protein product, partial [Meganyctiphanes norvegica]